MKKKIIYLVALAVISTTAFFVGRTSSKKEMDFATYCQVAENIVDWNTDGEELSIYTADGCEVYAYRSAEIYRDRQFVSVNERRKNEKN